MGQQVMIPTPAQPTRHYGIGAVNYHTGETVVLLRRHKRRREIAELLQALVDKHPTGTIYVAWDNACTHEDDEVEMVVRAAAGRLVLLYLTSLEFLVEPDRDASSAISVARSPIASSSRPSRLS